jgi:hypothetical protein
VDSNIVDPGEDAQQMLEAVVTAAWCSYSDILVLAHDLQWRDA